MRLDWRRPPRLGHWTWQSTAAPDREICLEQRGRKTSRYDPELVGSARCADVQKVSRFVIGGINTGIDVYEYDVIELETFDLPHIRDFHTWSEREVLCEHSR